MKTIEKGLTKEKVIEISTIKQEPKWMQEFRLKSFETFQKTANPNFGPELKIDFDDINFYKKVSDVKKDWNEIPKEVKKTFDKIGLPEAEQKY